jgi:hypothetical protein
VNILSQAFTVPILGSVSLCPMMSSTVCPLSVSTSQCNDFWFCATTSTAEFYSLSAFCQYRTLYCLLVFCHHVHCCFLQSVYFLSVPYTVLSLSFLPPCPLLFSTVCRPCVCTSHCTLCWFCISMSTAVFYSLSNVCQYLKK